MREHDGWHGNDGNDGLGFLSFLFGLIVLVLFVLAAANGVKWVWDQRREAKTETAESALDTLKKRYAKGEIGREEFERVKREIG